MEKLKFIAPNIFSTTKKFNFKPAPINPDLVTTCIEFAYEMAYGCGHHRNHRSGGSQGRKSGEKFCNTFQGKLAEMAFCDYLKLNQIENESIDLNVYGEGVWDNYDLVVNSYKISIKSASHFSNLLLLETLDWNSNGEYSPDLLNGKNTVYDFTVLVRISPDIKSEFRKRNLFYSDEILSKTAIVDFVSRQNWQYDIPGFITYEMFLKIIREGFILPKNALLNGKTRMDAENYYVQAGDLLPVNNILKDFRNKNLE